MAIVNRKFAEHYFKGSSPIGKRLGFGGGPRTKLNIDIVGVVADALYEGPREGVRRQVFIPNFGKNSTVFYVRTQSSSADVFDAIRKEVRQLDAGIPVYAMKTVEGQLDETLLTDRLIAMLSAGFGAIATLLASIGLYGVMAFVVARRRKELGIRLALGAEPGSVMLLVMREVLLLLGDRPRGGHSVGDRARAVRVGTALRHTSRRFGDRRLDGRAPDRRVCSRRTRSREAREQDRSHSGAADGLTVRI